jgi:hypothetical protein
MDLKQQLGLVIATLAVIATAVNWIGQGSILNRAGFLGATAFGIWLIWP